MICCHIFLRLEKISTHALTWSATSSHIGSCAFLCGFQLTHSRGVRLVWLDVAVLIIVFQLTHSRGVRPTSPDSLHSPKNFNSRTHVECDPWLLDLPICIKISTHALTWSATATETRDMMIAIDFNSRTHVECDGTLKICQRTGGNFNSRTHVECDVYFDTYEIVRHLFQLTHSRGVRPRRSV